MRKEIIGRHVADSALPALVDHVLLHLGVESLEFGVRGWELVVGGVGHGVWVWGLGLGRMGNGFKVEGCGCILLHLAVEQGHPV